MQKINKHRQSIEAELDETGQKFKNQEWENDYQKYVTRKQKEGKEPRSRVDWKETYDYWMNDSPMARGNAFNKKACDEKWYPFDEVHLENGKRVDGYDPFKKEIISRKATDFDEISLSTFEKHLQEMKDNYYPGLIIKTKKPGYEKIRNTRLEGKQILEVPSTNKSFDKIDEYINLAETKYGIGIRFRDE